MPIEWMPACTKKGPLAQLPGLWDAEVVGYAKQITNSPVHANRVTDNLQYGRSISTAAKLASSASKMRGMIGGWVCTPVHWETYPQWPGLGASLQWTCKAADAVQALLTWRVIQTVQMCVCQPFHDARRTQPFGKWY